MDDQPTTPFPNPEPIPERADLTPATPNLPQAPHPTRSVVLPLVVIGLVIAVGVGIAAALSGGGTNLPDELAGQPRVESGPMAEIAEAFGGMEIEGISFDVAMYGSELQPRYLVMLMEGDVPASDTEGLLSTVPTGLVGTGQGSVDFSRALTDEVDGVEYLCAPASGAGGTQPMTICIFQGDAGAGMVMAMSEESLPRMLDVTKGVAGAG